MLDITNANVLSYLRTAPGKKSAVIVSLNMTDQPQTISLDLKQAGVSGARVKTLLASDASLNATTSAGSVTLPPYASWVASVK